MVIWKCQHCGKEYKSTGEVHKCCPELRKQAK